MSTYAHRSLHQGGNISAFFLVPCTGYNVIPIDQEPLQGTVYLITPIPDGAFIPDGAHNFTFCVSTPSGLVSSFLSEPTSLVEDKFEDENIPQVLREITDLPVEVLASLAHVSRNAYYKWLDGKGVSEEHVARLAELLDTFRTLHDLHGSGIRQFLEIPGPGGKPIDLLAAGDSSAVIGLAMRPPSKPKVISSVSEAAWETSGLSGWLRPTIKLSWEVPRLTSFERDEAFDRLSPRFLPNKEKPHNDIDEDDAAFVAWGFIVE